MNSFSDEWIIYRLTNTHRVVPGDQRSRHGGQAGLRPGEGPRLRGDRRPQGEAGTRPAGLLQVRQTHHDPHEKPLGTERVERTLERQVRKRSFHREDSEDFSMFIDTSGVSAADQSRSCYSYATRERHQIKNSLGWSYPFSHMANVVKWAA